VRIVGFYNYVEARLSGMSVRVADLKEKHLFCFFRYYLGEIQIVSKNQQLFFIDIIIFGRAIKYVRGVLKLTWKDNADTLALHVSFKL
jgi:hypothetical protein